MERGEVPLNYAVIDVETTGLRAGIDRVTEIGLVRVCKGEIRDTWHTLVNPGIPVPAPIQRLTGITTAMLQDADDFSAVAEMLESLTYDCVVVGHHVAFDYAFLRNEMKLAGMAWTRKTVCTAELARLMHPGFRSHSLRALCRHYRVVNANPHRALPDARATAEIFIQLQKQPGAPDLPKLIFESKNKLHIPESLRKTIHAEIPKVPGIYFFIGRNNKPVYIGKAANLHARVKSHFRGDGNSLKILAMAARIKKINFNLAGSDLMAAFLEDHEIRHHWPKWNDAQKKPNYRFDVISYCDMAGRHRLAISRSVKPIPSLRTFHAYHEATEFVRTHVNRYSLNGKWCGIPDLEHGGFSNHEKGFQEMLQDLLGSSSIEIFLLAGRTPGEHGFILLENGMYQGTGFIAASIPKTLETFQGLLVPRYSSATTDNLIRQMKAHKSPDLVFVNASAKVERNRALPEDSSAKPVPAGGEE